MTTIVIWKCVKPYFKELIYRGRSEVQFLTYNIQKFTSKRVRMYLHLLYGMVRKSVSILIAVD